MLPEKLLDVVFVGDTVIPRFLTPRDAVWVRSLIGELDGFVGRPGRELDEAESAICGLCRDQGAPWRAATGMLKVLSQAYPRKVVAAARPLEIRRALFERSGAGLARDEAIEGAATELGIAKEEVMRGLFADRPGQRRVLGPETPPDPQRMIEQFNLALVQGLLMRSEQVSALVREHVRSVVRFAKLGGLLCTYIQDEAGTTIELSGPLSLFRNTTRYGHALATFFPSVVSTPGWSLTAVCLLQPRGLEQGAWVDGEPPPPRRYRLHLDATVPVHRAHALPSDADSALERKLVRDVKRLKRGWEIKRETTAVRVGSSVFFPDFKLVRGERQVLVEVVGYYTPQYLENKLRKLREAKLRDFIVCIDRSLSCDDGEVTADVVLRYERRVDAGALLDAAEGMERGTPCRFEEAVRGREVG
jgi:hypothetical protein